MDLFRLSWRQLMRHPIRSLLTLLSVAVALFLLVTLRTMVTTLEQGTVGLRSDRLYVGSAVSLFVDMPLSYQQRIQSVPGVTRVCKFQWFGGYYQDPKNFFGQFAIDPEELFDVYPELEVVSGSREAFIANRSGCMIGAGIAEIYGWKVGDRIPITGAIFPHPDGSDKAWEFTCEAIYEPTAQNFDDRTFYFHWELFEETLKQTETGVGGVGVFVVEIDEAANPSTVMGSIDAQFENGPQRTKSTTESEFQSQFISMFGNVPFFVSAIGGGVLIAILLACVNTMLMAAREQTRDIGILKALGFTDGAVAWVLGAQALLLCFLGGLIGVGLALAAAPALAAVMGGMLPGYRVVGSTLILAAVVTLVLGLLAGLAPVWRARALRPIEALAARA